MTFANLNTAIDVFKVSFLMLLCRIAQSKITNISSRIFR